MDSSVFPFSPDDWVDSEDEDSENDGARKHKEEQLRRTQTLTSLEMPYHIIPGPDGLLYASSFSKNQVHRLINDSWTVFSDGSRKGLDGASGLAFMRDTSLLVASFGNDVIFQFASDGQYKGVFSSVDALDCPEGLTVSEDSVFVANFMGDRIVRLHWPSGKLLQILTPFLPLDGPQALLLVPPPMNSLRLGATHRLLISAYHDHRILALDFNSSNVVANSVFATVDSPVGLVVASDRSLLCSSYRLNKVLRFDLATGKSLGDFATNGGLGGPVGISGPAGIAMGDDMTVWVASFASNRVLRFSYYTRH